MVVSTLTGLGNLPCDIFQIVGAMRIGIHIRVITRSKAAMSYLVVCVLRIGRSWNSSWIHSPVEGNGRHVSEAVLANLRWQGGSYNTLQLILRMSVSTVQQELAYTLKRADRSRCELFRIAYLHTVNMVRTNEVPVN